MCSQRIETVLNVFVAAVYLFDVADEAGAVGTHGSYQQSDTGTDIGTRHPAAAQLALTVVTYHDSTMGVAENNLCTHVYQSVYEEQSTLEHLLMEQHAAASLCGHHDEHAEQVGGQPGPWRISQRHDGAVNEGVDDIVLLMGYKEVVTIFLYLHTQSAEGIGYDAEVF